jgi:hypothetical protein
LDRRLVRRLSSSRSQKRKSRTSKAPHSARAAAFGFACSSAPPLSSKSSEYRGVSWYKRDSKWQAQIQVARKKEHLGYFDDEAEAARAFDVRAAELGRPTNF